MAQPRLIAAVALAIVAAAWGTIPLIVREDVAVSHLVAARVTLGAAALVGFLAVRRRLRLPPRHRWRIAVAGVVLAAHWAMFFASVKAADVAVALAVVFIGPILASVLAPFVLGERAGAWAYAGLVVGFLGVLMVVRPGGAATAAGVWWGVGAAATFASVYLIAKPAAEDLGGLVVAAGELGVAAVVMSPWAWRAGVESWRFLPQFLVLGVLLTGIGFLVFWNALGHLPVAVVSVLTYLEPAFAVVWAALFLGETPTPGAWAGVSLVVVGGLVAALSVARRPAGPGPVVIPAVGPEG
jgi:drug/metabolite transporter (DMT)-like permease